VAAAVEVIKGIYASGRRASLKEDEFKKLLRSLKILPDQNGH
jgi:hypothetical protein